LREIQELHTPGAYMKSRITLLVVVFSCLSPERAHSELDSTVEEHKSPSVVVTATRVETPRDQVASSVTVITAEDIERSQQVQLLEVLRSVPALDVVRTGGPGGNTSVFIRGANPEHTLVRIDGIRVNNPITPGRSFNFANLAVDNIERIEILRGPQSTLYGSDAIGGVISIITKKGRGAPSLTVSSEAGSFNTFVQQGEFSGGSDTYNYSFGVQRHDTRGISAAGEQYGNTERDGYENTSLSTRLGLAPMEMFDANLFVRYINATADLDNAGGPGGDALNRELDTEEFYVRAESNTSFLDDRLKQTYAVSYVDQEFRDDADPDELNPFNFQRSRFKGSSVQFDFQNVYTVADSLDLLAGFESTREKGSSSFLSDGQFGPFESRFDEQTATINGYYLQALVDTDQSFFSAFGLRLDDHSRFGDEITWRVAPGYLLPNKTTRLTSSIGTGFKAPSLFQLYSDFGSEELSPEKSLGLDVGIEQEFLGGRAVFGTTYFWNRFSDLITFDPDTFVYSNIAEARSYGMEVFSRLNLFEDLDLGLNYTYTDTEDKDSGRSLLRRARNKLGANLNYLFMDNASLNLDVLYVGSRYDNNFETFPATRVRLGGYTRVNLGSTYQISDNIDIFARIENLFDKQYEEVFGFGTPGIAGYGGLRFSL